MDEGQLLEVGAHSLVAVLGVWLGLTVVTRSGLPSARVFGFVGLALAGWSSSIIVRILSTSAGARTVAYAGEEVMAAIAIPGVVHLSLAIASEGHPTRSQLRIVAIAYLASLVFTVPKLLDPQMSPPLMVGDPFPGWLYGWGWLASRLAPLILGVVWLATETRRAERDTVRRRQLAAALATVFTGAVGASMRVLPGIGQSPAWIGVSLVALAIVFAAYTVFAAGIFLGPSVAGRAFRTSLVVGFGLFFLAVGLLVVDTASRSVTGLDLPLFAVMATVVAVAVYEPVAARIRELLSGAEGPRGVARRRLLRALGQSALTAHAADSGVQPALTRLAAALDVAGIEVIRSDGTILATGGPREPVGELLSIPLVADGQRHGELRVARRPSGAPLSPRDEELLRTSAAYVASALRTGRREEEQVESLAGLSQERADVEQQASALHSALVEHASQPAALHVAALGPLHVERDGVPIVRWGGDKAGTRQAQGLFAFLLDRGERGVAKDEALELIWPDTDLDRADLAFHRTLVGLRQTLEPDRGRGSSQVIRFQNDRYRLDPTVIGWSDVDAFAARLDEARRASTDDERIRLLETARELYRGDYLDDCPFYGDSSHVEDRRALLRGRFVDLLIAVGEGYEARGDRLSAGDAFREALRVAPEGCPPAVAGLARLGF